MLERGWDCCVVTKILDLYFILETDNFVNYVETKAALAVFLDEIILISDKASFETLKNISKTLFNHHKSDLKDVFLSGGFFSKDISEVLKQKGSSCVASDNPSLKKILRGQVSYKNLGTTISKIAVDKQENQIEYIINASNFMIKTSSAVIPQIKKGISEIEARNMFDLQLHRQGADRLGVPTMVSFSNESRFTDPVPTYRKLHEGDLVMFEISAGYKSEAPILGRTFFYKTHEKKTLEIFQKALGAYKKMIDWIAVGKLSSKAFEILAGSLGDLSHFMTAVPGFGLGASSDYFYISPTSSHIFRNNEALVTILSLSIPEIGFIRFSDTLLVAGDKMLLTQFEYASLIQ